jgi:hypothetical protein
MSNLSLSALLSTCVDGDVYNINALSWDIHMNQDPIETMKRNGRRRTDETKAPE